MFRIGNVSKSGMTLSAGDFVARRRAPDQIRRRPAPLATTCPAIAQPVKRGDKSDRARFCAEIIRKMQNAIASHLSRAPLIGQGEANAWLTARSTTNRGDRNSAYRKAICGFLIPDFATLSQNLAQGVLTPRTDGLESLPKKILKEEG